MQKTDNKLLLPDFQRFLSQRKLAPEKYIPFYASWVSKYLLYADQQGDNKPQDLVAEMFINSLSSSSKHTDWQVQQAEDALRVYLTHFLPDQINKIVATEYGPSVGAQLIINAMRDALRVKHYSYRTEQAYLAGVGRFSKYLQSVYGKSLTDIESADVRDYMTHLATRKNVAASTQNIAFNAILFLMRNVLNRSMDDLGSAVRAKRGSKLPVVLTIEEVSRVFGQMTGPELLMVRLIYGSGLRLMELARLRVQDIDFQMNSITVRDGKGAKDRLRFSQKL